MKKKHSNGYRHELKYYLNSGDYVLLSNLLKNTLKSDDNTNVASIDNEGLVTYTGIEGFATVTMTVTGTNSSGETVTRSV